MKYILHNVDHNNADYILMVRTAVFAHKETPAENRGNLKGSSKEGVISFDGGKSFYYKHNKQSISVWPNY